MMEKQKLTHENMELQQRLNQLQDEQQAVVSSMQEQAFQLQTEIDELKQRLQFNNEVGQVTTVHFNYICDETAEIFGHCAFCRLLL